MKFIDEHDGHAINYLKRIIYACIVISIIHIVISTYIHLNSWVVDGRTIISLDVPIFFQTFSYAINYLSIWFCIFTIGYQITKILDTLPVKIIIGIVLLPSPIYPMIIFIADDSWDPFYRYLLSFSSLLATFLVSQIAISDIKSLKRSR